ncbi:FCS-Like Zinc finger 5-like [Rhododendron vialii]|uniref:FCS-Like Zinc finger 5-like n=1 Tax=Rhododendron vialii TaxID=182163 RepID=UPI00265D9520|nr:FCS-Like Zinc finger 5-like [Rhododendron vialii]
MLLGKRGRGPMKRTTSMTGINVDLADEEPSDSVMNELVETASPSRRDRKRSSGGEGDNSMVVETAPFLRTCGLCNSSLRPSRDIFMYRGDTAFCSLECREQQIKHDERNEKCSVAANPMKDGNHHHHRHRSAPATATATATTTSQA